MTHLTLTTEDKARFFAQYWGQEVFTVDYENKPIIYKNWGSTADAIYRNEFQEAHLTLKSLSQISEEDALEVACLQWPMYRNRKVDTEWLKRILETLVNDNTIHQYLKSKGYYVPHYIPSIGRCLTEEEAVKAGWINIANQ